MKYIKQLESRILHVAARLLPGATSLRVKIHRKRGVKIGKNVFIGSDVYIDDFSPEYILIEDNAEINARCIVLAHDGVKVKSVKIRKGALIGVGTVIFPGVEIGEGAIVGGNSTVSRDIPPKALAFGSPAKVLRFIDGGEAVKEWREKGRKWLQYTDQEKELLIDRTY
jgi:acetyltransferase-like isoleucine patch superfamily enzyme